MIEFRNISFSKTDISDEEIDEVVKTQQSGWITVSPKLELFEKQMAGYCTTSMKAAKVNNFITTIKSTSVSNESGRW